MERFALAAPPLSVLSSSPKLSRRAAVAYIPAPPAALAPSGERLDPSLDDAASDWLKLKLKQQLRTLARKISEIKRRRAADLSTSNLRFPRRAD